MTPTPGDGPHDGLGQRLRDQARAQRRTARVLAKAGMIAVLRPDKYARMGTAVRRVGAGPLTGLSLAAVRRPQGVGLVDERGALTWGELDARSDALAEALREVADRALADDAPIGVLCRNHRGFLDALGASAKLGLDVLLLNTGFSGPQMAEVMEREGARLVIYDEEFDAILGETRERIEGLVEVVAWADSLTSGPASGDPDAPTVLRTETLIATRAGLRPPRPRRTGRVVLLTSGTTGTPKGARRSASGGGGALAAMFERIPWRAEQPVVVAAPMFHAWGFGQMAVAATLACTIITRRKFDPEATLALAAEHDAVGLAVVPVMIERIMDLPDEVLDRYRLPLLRFVTASGSRMRGESVTAFMDRFGDVVFNSYNATEVGLISTALPADLRAAPDTAGKPVRGSRVRILDDDGAVLPTGEIGRIVVLSDSVFEGYTSGDTKDDADGYMVSGDLGRLDEAGRLFVVGRDDEMIVSGGENVYPLEVERCLDAHPDVREVAVIGVDDEKYGQRLAAFVALADGASATEDDLKAHVKAQLAGYKVPRDVTLLDELPRNASGKVVKKDLAG